MSTFWTRARHVTSSCRCTLCNPTRTGVTRKVNLNTTPARRQHGINDSLTLFYGTVMAAALYTDASVKIGRRRRLEENISREKEETHALEESNEERLQALGLERSEETCLSGDSVSLIDISMGNMASLDFLGRAGDGHYRPNSSKTEHAEILNDLSSKELARLKQERARAERALKTLSRRLVDADTKDSSALTKIYSSIAHYSNLRTRAQNGLDEVRGHKTAEGPKWYPRGFKVTVEETVKPLLERIGLLEEQALTRGQMLSAITTSLSAPRNTPPVSSQSTKELWEDSSSEMSTPYWIKRQEMVVTLFIYKLLQNIGIAGDMSVTQLEGEATRTFAEQDIFKGLAEKIETAESVISALTKAQDNDDMLLRVETPSIVQFSCPGNEEKLERTKLNNALSDTFARCRDGKSLITNICETLVTSPVSPDHRSFNIMIINFARLHQWQASRLAIEAFEHTGKSIDSITVAAMLRTYKSLRMESRFRAVMHRMDVKNGVGLVPANAKTRYSLRSIRYINTNDTNDTRIVPGTKYLRVPRSTAIYDALITGLLNFGDMRSACQEFANLIQSGITPSMEVLNALLFHFLQRRDRMTGKALGRWILDGKTHGSRGDMLDAVYLLAQIEMLPTPVRSGGELSRINDFALQRQLLSKPLEPTDLEDVDKRDMAVIAQRLDFIRRLDRPCLQLYFTGDTVENLTEDITEEPALPSFNLMSYQPRNLRERAAVRLVYLHQQYEKNYGCLPSGAEGVDELIEAVGKASRWVASTDRKYQAEVKKQERQRLLQEATESRAERRRQQGMLKDGEEGAVTARDQGVVPTTSLNAKSSCPTLREVSDEQDRQDRRSSSSRTHDYFATHRWVADGAAASQA